MESNQASISSLLEVTDQHEGAGLLPVHQQELPQSFTSHRSQLLWNTSTKINRQEQTWTTLEESNMDDDWNVGRHRIVRILDEVHSCPDSRQTSTKGNTWVNGMLSKAQHNTRQDSVWPDSCTSLCEEARETARQHWEEERHQMDPARQLSGILGILQMTPSTTTLPRMQGRNGCVLKFRHAMYCPK